eukprot:COSAG01_NODE_16970_length_1189_cov_1.240367_2_plen_376_part_01
MYCNSRAEADGTFDATPCSTERRFAIFVRPIDCSSLPAECTSLHREACYDKPNSCGNCTAGFIGITGHSNTGCQADCSSMPQPLCDSLHRHACSSTVGGQPNTCGECKDGFSGAPGFSNTLCTLDSLQGAVLPSCYEILQRADPKALTGQYIVAPYESDAHETVYCEMETDTQDISGYHGGWTSIFVSDSVNCNGQQPRRRPSPPLFGVAPNTYLETCNRYNLEYTTDVLSLRSRETETEVMIGFINEGGGIVERASRAKFLMPQQWKEATPMSYLRQHNNVMAAIGENKQRRNTTLVYGYGDFATDRCSFDGMKGNNTYAELKCKDGNPPHGGTCSDGTALPDTTGGRKLAHNPFANFFRGQICLTGNTESNTGL